MIVFISHHSSDSQTAHRIFERLRQHGVLSYLDVVDPLIGKNGEDLADHLRAQMSRCDHLIAVISSGTRDSQWVPWEIGVATEKEYPLAAYSEMVGLMPEFLRAWPRLRNMTDVDSYVYASRAENAAKTARRAMGYETASVQNAGVKAFYRDLRSRLGG